MSRQSETQAITDLLREAVLLQAAADPEPYLKLEITLAQLRAVMVLFARGPLPTSTLARSLDVSRAVVTGIVDRLEGQGLVRRQAVPSDRRVTLVALTPVGEALVEELTTSTVTGFSALLEHLNEDELHGLRLGCAALVRALRHRVDASASQPS